MDKELNSALEKMLVERSEITGRSISKEQMGRVVWSAP